MADLHDDFHQRLAHIRQDVIALKWQTEELIKVSRELILIHHQLVARGRALHESTGGTVTVLRGLDKS